MIRIQLVLLASIVILGSRVSLQAADIVFDNTSEAIGSGFSSTNLTAVWGDFVRLSRTGRLSEFAFAMFNSGSSAGALTSATVTINFYDYTGGNIGTSYGSFNRNFAGSLATSSYSIFTATGLDSSNIDLNSTDIFITHQLSNVVGSTRMGSVATYSTATSAGTNLTTGYYRSIGGTTDSNVIVSGQTVSNLYLKVGLAIVPEPSSYVLSILAMTVCYAVRKRKPAPRQPECGRNRWADAGAKRLGRESSK